MAVTEQQLEAAKVKFISNTGFLEAIVQSDDTTDVAIGNNKTLQSVAKLYKQITATYVALEVSGNKDKSNGYVGLTGYNINLYNSDGTIKSAITTATTLARTWTLPDKSGTFAFTSDITLTALGLNNVNNTSDANKPISTAQATAFAARELLANKAVDFLTVDNTKFPSVQAVKTYVDNATTGLLNDRGNWSASGGNYPNAGGSGTAGAIRKGDFYYINVAGNLGGVVVNVGDSVRAMVDAPGQTAGNWNILESNIGYVPENVTSKDATGGYAGLTLFKLNVMNAAGNIKSFLTTVATAARTYTFPDKDGTVAMVSDITATSTGVNTGDETNATLLQKLGITTSFSNGVLSTVLTALGAGSNAAIAATDTILQALAKLQAQIKAVPYDFMGFTPSKPGVSAKVLYVQTGRAFTIPANFTGSRVKSMTAAAAATVWTISKNGTSVGTFSWAVGATVPTLATTGGTAISFVAGDELLITAGSTQDSTLADIGVHILANIT